MTKKVKPGCTARIEAKEPSPQGPAYGRGAKLHIA